MAIGTVFAYVGEDRLDVALRAFHLLVHAAQRIRGFVVVEFRHRADGAPTCSSVAVFARDGERTMGVARGFFLRIACIEGRTRRHP